MRGLRQSVGTSEVPQVAAEFLLVRFGGVFPWPIQFMSLVTIMLDKMVNMRLPAIFHRC